MELKPLFIIFSFQITLYIDLIDNISDHLPLFYLNVPYRMYIHYLVSLMSDQTGVGLIVKQLNFIKLF